MARNQEKAQSMLYRFREAQAAELGLGTSRGDRRPRVTSSVSSIRDCEKWRSDVLREISRKVSKIQDFGLTDFEVRDLNDEINKLIREKGAWEHQIIALGGANYRRGMPRMLDDAGQEVPGSRGYKYFGRAKDLPGVKELFVRTEEQQEEVESFRSLKYKRFNNLPPAYYGDEDEKDGLLDWEDEQEQQAWKDGYADILQQLGIEAEIESIPRKKAVRLDEIANGKRKGGDQARSKRQKGKDGEKVELQVPAEGRSDEFKLYYSVLDPPELEMPQVPNRKETEAFILAAKKKALRDEYIGK